MWKKLLLLVAVFFVTSGLSTANVQAQVKTPTVKEATHSALTSEEVSTAGANLESTASGELGKLFTVGGSSGLTETTGQTQGKLEKFVLENTNDEFKVWHALKWAIRKSVERGMSANTVVLVLMFPLVTALIAASRHILGLQGFGIFTPAIVAVGFLATGLMMGFLLFLVIILAATLGRVLIRRLKLAYLPRTSLMLWFVSLTVVGLLLVAPLINLKDMANLSIFPILLMVLLAETFIEVQSKRSMSQAVEMTLETLLLASICYFVMNLEVVQKLVVMNPELMLISVALFNIFLGKFDGLRLLEYWRFRRLMK
jgi:hypothetical protein